MKTALITVKTPDYMKIGLITLKTPMVTMKKHKFLKLF